MTKYASDQIDLALYHMIRSRASRIGHIKKCKSGETIHKWKKELKSLERRIKILKRANKKMYGKMKEITASPFDRKEVVFIKDQENDMEYFE